MKRARFAYTLVELMMAVAVVGVVVAMAVPAFSPNVASALESTADIVAADLMEARQLAVANNSRYTVTFDLTENRFYLEHTGTNAALATLPTSLYRNTANTATRRYFDLDELPHLGPTVRLHRILADGTSTDVSAIEFGPLGATTASADTIVWLAAGEGASLRYAGLRINAVTGLAQTFTVDATGPATGS